MKSLDTNIFGLNEKQVNNSIDKYGLLEPLINTSLETEEKKYHISYVCGLLKKSQRTIQRYCQKFKEAGFKALARKTRNDKGKYRVFSKEILQRCIKLLDENPNRSIVKLKQLLKTDKTIRERVDKISNTAFYHHLRAAGYDKKRRVKEKNKRSFTRFEASQANELIQADARDGIPLPDPENPKKTKMTFCFLWMDDFSRKILFAKYYWNEKLPNFEDSFRQLILRWGLFAKILCDNGSVYVSKIFYFIANALGIKIIHHGPYKSWVKGKVEFIMKVLKRFQEELRLIDIKTIEELNELLAAYIEVEYNNKLHSSTGETPNNRYFNSIKLNPAKRIKDLAFFNSLFLHRENRVVDKFKQVRFKNNIYRIQGLPIGEYIEIRFNPFDLSDIQIFHKNVYYCNLKAYKLSRKEAKNIIEEKRKPTKLISKEATLYFQQLKEKYNELKKNQSNNISFSNLKNKNKGKNNDRTN